VRKGDPDRPAVDEKLDVHRIGVAGSDSDNQCLVDAVHWLFAQRSVAVKSVNIRTRELVTIAPAAGGEQTDSMNKKAAS